MEEEIQEVSPKFKSNIWSSPQQSTSWRIYLTEMGDSPENHVEAVDLIRTAPGGDIIDIFITCPGGSVDIADMYLSAISRSAAQVNTHGIGEVASAAVTVFLAGDVRVCHPGGYFMFHNVQFGGMGGDSANVFSRSKFYDRLFKEKFLDPYSEVLTKEEISELFDRSGEIFLTSAEMKSRLADSEKAVKEQDGGFMHVPQPELDPRLVQKTPTVYAQEHLENDEFAITLDDGYRKVFKLSTLSSKHFGEYNQKELEEVGLIFGLTLSGLSRDESLEELVDEIKNGRQGDHKQWQH